MKVTFKKGIDAINSTFNKIKSNKQILYILVLTMLVLFSVALNVAFSAFTNTASSIAANIKVKGMEYAMTINGTSGTVIAVNANNVTKSNVKITALNNVSSKYELIYHVCSDSSCTSFITKPSNINVMYSSRTTDVISGDITSSGTKSIRVVSSNTSNSVYYIKLDINAGYSYNTLALQNMIMTEYSEEDLEVLTYVDGTLSNSFPTTNDYTGSVTCNNDAGNSGATGTVTWDGSKYVLSISNVDSNRTFCNVNYYSEAFYITDHSGANAPTLDSNMIPVVYDNKTDTWEKAPTTQIGWYNYDFQTWANAVTVTSSTRNTYKNASVGTPISMDDILGMWVWIPRYEYYIVNPGKSLTAAEIFVNFISLDKTTPTTNYIIHPAFRNGTSYKHSKNYDLGGWNKEQSGYWYGKFTTGSTAPNTSLQETITSNIFIKPNVAMMQYQKIYNQFQTATYVASTHGISTFDAHMGKNDEWGGIAYLSQSKYGKYGNSLYSGADKEVYLNNSSGENYYCTTGRSSGSYPGASGEALSSYGTYEYNNCPASSYSSSNCSSSVRTTNNTKGTGASTTGNIYGVYDMVGGTVVYVMGWTDQYSAPFGGYMTGEGYATAVNESGFTSQPNEKYFNKYTSTDVKTACNGVPCPGLGWSTETGDSGSDSYQLWGWQQNTSHNWYNDVMAPPGTWIIRSHAIYYNLGIYFGIFYSDGWSGYENTGGGFRVSLGFK